MSCAAASLGPLIPEAAAGYGFVRSPVGTHTSKTMMLRELTLLMGASRAEAEYAERRGLVVGENVTLKGTQATRKETFQRLGQLYGLRREMVLYRALRDLWSVGEGERPLLALLCASARDPLLRVTAPAVLEVPEGSVVTPQRLEEQVQV